VISVVCWKWRGKTMGHTRPEYGARHVNTLASMVSRHLKMKHEVVCVTDDPKGIDGSVRIVPLWDELRDQGRCFLRLKAFSKDMADILGPRFVSLDLDTVITGPLDPVFDRPESFVVWADPSRLLPYCGSQWMMTAGAHADVWEKFDHATWQRLKPEKGWHGSDQAWMAHAIPNAATWGKQDGVYSFRMHLLKVRGGDPLGRRLQQRIRLKGVPRLPENASIVHFHGIYDPSQVHLQNQIPWIAEHWQ
jgi:hypothetical protein